MRADPPPIERFAQAQPAGSTLNTLVLVGDELIEVTPVGQSVESSLELARGMQARFFFRLVRNVAENRWDLDGYDTQIAISVRTGEERWTKIEPVRRFPSKDAAVMWAIHRRNR